VRRLWLPAAVLALSIVAPAHAAPEHAEIAYASGDKLWAARADGSERRLLGTGGQPAWSPDGARLAYMKGDEDGSQIVLLGDGDMAPLRKGVSDQSPAWSPDGSQLVFSRFAARGNRYRSSIVVLDLASRAERVLVTHRLFPRFDYVAQPAWSPDGATIAYTHSRIDREADIRPEIRTVPADGGASRLLVRDAQSPGWSPSGDRLAFASVRDRNGKICSSDQCWFAGEIYTAAADGSDPVRLTDNEGNDAGPRWSPDGSRILFSSDRNLPSRGGQWTEAEEVYSIGADGSCLTWLTNGTPPSGGATWRPASGGRFDPGSCDPGERAPRADHPRLPSVRGGLWLGPEHRGLLLSDVGRAGRSRFLFYDDCARFEGCAETIELASEPACPRRFLPRHPQRRFRMRGARVLYDGREHAAHVLSGRAITSIRLSRGNRLAEVRRLVAALRPYGASSARGRLAPPRAC
jgi:WD40-like Beta Propeller Repeat